MPFALLGQCDGFEPGPYSATLLGNATLNDLPGEVGDALAAYDLDGACLGRAELITFEGLSFFNLTVYGDDPVSSEDEGLMPGDVFVLEYHDVRSGAEKVTMWDAGGRLLWSQPCKSAHQWTLPLTTGCGWRLVAVHLASGEVLRTSVVR